MASLGPSCPARKNMVYGFMKPVGKGTVEGMESSQVLSRRDVATILSISLPTLWRMKKSGAFPPAMQISAGRVGWSACVVRAWLAARGMTNHTND